MKKYEMLEGRNIEERKARLEKQNKMIQRKLKSPEPSILGSSIFSYDISLNSLSLKTESEDLRDSTFQNYSSRSKKPSEVLYECLNSNFSEKDQKIIRLMAARREARMKDEEYAYSAKNHWEKEKIRREKELEAKKKSLKEYLAKKKRMEELENFIKKNVQNENFKQEKMMLELKINEKHEKVEKRQREMSLQKKKKPEHSNTSSQMLLHQEMKKQKEEEEGVEKALHLQLIAEKERKSQEKLQRLSEERCRKLKEESLKRELKWQSAKCLRDESDKAHEEEKLRHLKFSLRNQAVREERVHWTTEWKKRIISEKNKRERQQHALIYSRLKEEEKEKRSQIKQKIQVKESRMKILREKREAAISRSRHNARTMACLRQKMQATYDLSSSL